MSWVPEQEKLFSTGMMTSSRVMNRLKRARQIEELGLKRIIHPPVEEPKAVPGEFLMPDESREWMVACGPCPFCGMKNQHIMKRVCQRGQKPKFYIRCWNSECNFITAEWPSSAAAIRHFKIVSVLSQ